MFHKTKQKKDFTIFFFWCLQVSQFSSVHFGVTNSTLMSENFRPAQFLNDRYVYWSGASSLLPPAHVLMLALILLYLLNSLFQWIILTSFKVPGFYSVLVLYQVFPLTTDSLIICEYRIFSPPPSYINQQFLLLLLYKMNSWPKLQKS